jgi:sugar fermentation stimulation protein A
MKYLFSKSLIEGLIKSRPNRFIMNVEINGKIEKCHCPSTGRIGDLRFEDISCLVSESDNSKRKTKYTVEAISLDSKNWIGINQTRDNAFVEFFLKNGMLNELVGKVEKIRREVVLGKSRVDFLINDRDYIEVKSPLKELLIEGIEKHPKYEKSKRDFNSFDRLIKHFGEISSSIKKGSMAVLLMCYIYEGEEFKVPPVEDSNKEIVNAARKAREKGMENWQINLKLDKEGVSLLKLRKLNLF